MGTAHFNSTLSLRLSVAITVLSMASHSVALAMDCNSNGIQDNMDIAGATSLDCNTNSVPDECDLLAATTCCMPHAGPGCDSPTIESCVCLVDPYCCDVAWDRTCVDDVSSEGCGFCDNDCNTNSIPDECDILPPTTTCCASNTDPGCDSSVIESCVCAIDPYCCDVAWDRTCVDEVVSKGCGSCDNDCNDNNIPDECESDPAPDLDGNGRVDLADFMVLVGCVTSPCTQPTCEPRYVNSCCALADSENDGDVDLFDYGSFQRSITESCPDPTDNPCVVGGCCPQNKVCTDVLGICCDSGEVWLDNVCCPLARACPGVCCDPGSSCNQNTLQCFGCPDPTDTLCAVGGCCPAGLNCTDVQGECCPQGETFCNGACRPLNECIS